MGCELQGNLGIGLFMEEMMLKEGMADARRWRWTAHIGYGEGEMNGIRTQGGRGLKGGGDSLSIESLRDRERGSEGVFQYGNLRVSLVDSNCIQA